MHCVHTCWCNADVAHNDMQPLEALDGGGLQPLVTPNQPTQARASISTSSSFIHAFFLTSLGHD